MVAVNNLNPRFPLGQVVATPGALSALESTGQTALELLQRHVRLDQGELEDEDHELNQQAVTNGDRILSGYLWTSPRMVAASAREYPCSVTSRTASRLNSSLCLRRFVLDIFHSPHEQSTLLTERPPFVGKSMGLVLAVRVH